MVESPRSGTIAVVMKLAVLCFLHFNGLLSYLIVGVLQVLTCFISASAHTARHAKGLRTGRAPPAGGQPGGPAVCATCTSNSTAAARCC